MGRTAPSHGPSSGQTWGSRRRCRARARTESHLAATTDVGPQARDPSSQDTLFQPVQRNARESRAAPSASLPLEAAWMLSVLEMKRVLAHSLGCQLRCQLCREETRRKQRLEEEEIRTGGKGKSHRACAIWEPPPQVGPKRPSQLLSSGFGCECAVGEAFHPLCALSTALCPAEPHSLTGRRGDWHLTRRGAAAGRAHT